MSFEPIASDLAALGFSEDHGRIYLRLLQLGPAKVSDLSPYFDCSRSKLYRLLGDLAEEGHVTKSLERPTVYEAVGPEQLFELGYERLQRKCDRLQEVEETRRDELEQLAKNGRRKTTSGTWRTTSGTARIFDEMASMIQTAEGSVEVCCSHPLGLASDLPVVRSFWRSLGERARERDVKTRCLLALANAEEAPIEPEDTTAPVEVRELETDKVVHFLLVDGAKLLTWLQPTDSTPPDEGENVAARTDVRGSLHVHRMLFERAWADTSERR